MPKPRKTFKNKITSDEIKRQKKIAEKNQKEEDLTLPQFLILFILNL